MVKNLNNATGQAVRKLAADGMSVSEIMSALNVSYQTVYRYAKGFFKQNSHEDIRELRRVGVSVFDIKIITGKDPKIISRVCRDMGLGLTDEEYQEERKRDSERKAHSEDWIRNYIREKSGGRLEYHSGYKNMDSPVIVRCTHCRKDQKKAMSNFRGNNYVRCGICFYDERVEERKRERAEQREKEKKKKQIEKETSRLIRASNGKQLSFGFCACGEMLSRFDGNKGKQCPRCARRAESKNREIKRSRKISAAMVDRDITIQKLFRRDNGICYLCGKKCDWNDKEVRNDTIVCGDQYPSIDHVLPLAKGGLHSWDNVKLAHRICNSLKGDNYDIETVEKQNSESHDRCRNLSAVI